MAHHMKNIMPISCSTADKNVIGQKKENKKTATDIPIPYCVCWLNIKLFV